MSLRNNIAGYDINLYPQVVYKLFSVADHQVGQGFVEIQVGLVGLVVNCLCCPGLARG